MSCPGHFIFFLLLRLIISTSKSEMKPELSDPMTAVSGINAAVAATRAEVVDFRPQAPSKYSHSHAN